MMKKRFYFFWILLFLFFSKISFASDTKYYFIDGISNEKEIKPVTDRWLAIDKFRHVVASGFLMGISYNIAKLEGKMPRSKAIYFGVGFSLSLGIAKEFRDAHQPNNHASLKDIAADVLGIGLGILFFTDWFRY